MKLYTIDLIASEWDIHYDYINLPSFLIYKGCQSKHGRTKLSFIIGKIIIQLAYFLKGHGRVDFIKFRYLEVNND